MTQIRIDTEHTREVARRLIAESDRLSEIGHELQHATGGLDTWAWDGRSRWRAEPLLSRVRPESARAADSLDELGRKLRRVADTFEQEDDTAARELEGMPWVDFGIKVVAGAGVISGGMGRGRTKDDSGTVPPPRVYIINGINGVPVDGDNRDDNTIKLEQLLIKYGYTDENIRGVPCVYEKAFGEVDWRTDLSGTDLHGTKLGGFLKPVDWLTGMGAKGINSVTDTVANAANAATDLGTTATNAGIDLTNTVVGAGEVAIEHVRGEEGRYTQETFDWIKHDLQENPLAPGQKVIFIGHSGGGAIASNLSGMVETRLGYDVEGVVTMGSPVANFDQASRYAETVVGIRHQDDNVGRAYLRSEESRVGIPLAVAGTVLAPWGLLKDVTKLETADVLLRDYNPNIYYETVDDGVAKGAHGSYMDPDRPEINEQVMNILFERFPSMQ